MEQNSNSKSFENDRTKQKEKKKENEKKNGAPKAQSGGLEAVAVAEFMQLQNHLLYFVQGTLFTNFSCIAAFKAS